MNIITSELCFAIEFGKPFVHILDRSIRDDLKIQYKEIEKYYIMNGFHLNEVVNLVDEIKKIIRSKKKQLLRRNYYIAKKK